MSDGTEEHEARHRALLQTFPRLLHAGRPHLEYGRGWDGIIHGLLQEIDKLLNDEQVTALRIVQIKEKFGTLRLYYGVHERRALRVDVQDGQGLPVRPVVGEVAEPSFPTQEIDRLISAAEVMTGETCESCGQAGSVCRHGAWYTTLCDTCVGARIKERHRQDGVKR